jgi:GTP-binding protein LepA
MITRIYRNFCIIAHIDHGKSTLADRFLEYTHLVNKVEVDQVLDSMDLEREKGITIKSHCVRMIHSYNSQEYVLNLIDTPGHVDFSYEASRALASCEGAHTSGGLASQGIEAQTLKQSLLALDNDLEILPVVNKIDLPKADVEGTIQDLSDLLGCLPEEIMKVSAKNGEGVKDLLDAICAKLPAPQGNIDAPPKALIFDSFFDMFRGVVVLVRLFDGRLRKGERINLFATEHEYDIEEIGYLGLKLSPQEELTAGEVGYIIANIKEVADARVGDTITLAKGGCEEPLPGFKEPKPMVYSSIFPINSEDYENLVEAMAKLKLNDASLVYEKENSADLVMGFAVVF